MNRKGRGYWQSLENVIQEAKEIKKTLNVPTLPPHKVLKEKGYGSFSFAVSKYHGGMPSFREKLGEAQQIIEPGAWESFDFTLLMAHMAIDELDATTLPSQVTLKKHGYASLAQAIHKYHGGFPVFRRYFGESKERVLPGLWAKESYVLDYARRLILSQKLKRLPGSQILCATGHGSFVNAVTEHHGGITEIRKKLGDKKIHLKSGSWKSLDYTLKKAQEAMQEQGWTQLPCYKTLYKTGYCGIGGAIIKYHGGFTKFRELLPKVTPTQDHLENLLHEYVRGQQ